MRRQTLSLALVVGGVVTAADLLTKRWAGANFAGRVLEVIPRVLWFEYTENPGAAFSLFKDAGPVLGLAAVVAVGVVMRALRTVKSSTETFAFGLILGGALGNLMDRIFRGDGFLDGRVIDWIRLPNFPTFNLADSSITVAVAILLLRSLLQNRREPSAAEAGHS